MIILHVNIVYLTFAIQKYAVIYLRKLTSTRNMQNPQTTYINNNLFKSHFHQQYELQKT